MRTKVRVDENKRPKGFETAYGYGLTGYGLTGSRAYGMKPYGLTGLRAHTLQAYGLTGLRAYVLTCLDMQRSVIADRVRSRIAWDRAGSRTDL